MYEYKLLAQRVTTAGGLLQVTMEELRDAEGAGKLGANVRADIQRHLRSHNLRTLETRLPNDQSATVWLISPDTTHGELLLEIVSDLRGLGGAAA